eukprot:2618508-Prymnesium_polylepis.1
MRDIGAGRSGRAKQRSARRVAHATLTRSMVATDAGNCQCGALARYEERSSVSRAIVEPRRHIVSGSARRWRVGLGRDRRQQRPHGASRAWPRWDQLL